jgi:SAM-dependent methyltransferase
MKSPLHLLPPVLRTGVRRRLARLVRPAWLGTLHRTTPLSDHWGMERGTPIDRHYIWRFLDAHRDDIHGHVLEVKDSAYVEMFGEAVTRVDVLDMDQTNSGATIVADLGAADAIPSDEFDCIVLTQTLQFIFDVTAAIGHLHRMLRPGGVLLTTVPSITKTDRLLVNKDYWRFTMPTCRRLFGDMFGADHVEVDSYGNVRTAVAFLMGMAQEELSRDELDTRDDRFPVLITVRAVKAAGHAT